MTLTAEEQQKMSLIRRAAKDTTKPIRVRIPAELADRLDSIEKRAREAGMVFALSEACAEALEKLATRAERELERLGEGGSNAGDGDSDQ